MEAGDGMVNLSSQHHGTLLQCVLSDFYKLLGPFSVANRRLFTHDIFPGNTLDIFNQLIFELVRLHDFVCHAHLGPEKWQYQTITSIKVSSISNFLRFVEEE